MNGSMAALVAFVEARLDEDERTARFVLSSYAGHEPDWDVPCTGVVQTGGELVPTGDGPLAEHIARHDPARVLRAVEAKRRILDLVNDPDFHDGYTEAYRDVVRLLASEWSDHPRLPGRLDTMNWLRDDPLTAILAYLVVLGSIAVVVLAIVLAVKVA